MKSQWGERRGIATVELAMILPLFLVLVFALVDAGRLLLVDNEITNISRESANLAWRGTSFQSTVNTMFNVTGSTQFQADGYIIMSRIERDSNDNPVIVERWQGTDTANSHPSQIGALGGGATLPVPQLPRTGQQLIVAEVFMNYETATPIGAFLGASLPSFLYDAAYFY